VKQRDLTKRLTQVEAWRYKHGDTPACTSQLAELDHGRPEHRGGLCQFHFRMALPVVRATLRLMRQPHEVQRRKNLAAHEILKAKYRMAGVE